MRISTNKLISALLAIIVITVSSLSSAMAAESKENAELTREMILLNKLGITELTSPDYVLTKGDMARVIAKILLSDLYAGNSNSNYVDVDSSLSAADAIKHLSNMGIIDNNTRYYNPLIKATGNDLAVMFVGGILGYSKVSDDAWSMGVSIGAFKKTPITKKSYVTMSALAAFICENLDTPFLVGYTGSYKTDPNSTVLSLMDLKHIDGRLVSSPEGGIGSRKYTENTVTVGVGGQDICLKTGSVDVSGYLGARGDFYYSKSDEVLIYADFYDAEYITVYGTQITSVTGERIYYDDEDGESETINYNSCPVIYNGSIVSSSDMSLYVQPENGYINILTEAREVIALYVWDFEIGIIDGTDIYESKIYLADTVYPAKELLYKSCEEINVYLNNKASDINSLSRNQIVWYAFDSEGKKLTLYASTDNIFWGSYDSKGSDYIEINGKEYPYHENLFSNSKYPDIQLGETAMFYKGPTGEIFHYIPDKYIENNMYGYLLKVSNPASGLDDTVAIQLVNELGQLKELKLAKRIKYYDGSYGGSYVTAERNEVRSLNGLFDGGVLIDQLVRYSVNANNEIIMISRYQDLTDSSHPDYELGFLENTFTKVMENDSSSEYYMRYDTNGTGKFDNKYIAAANCLVFCVKPDLSEATVSTCSQTLSKKFYDNAKTTGEDISIYNSDRFLNVSMVVYKTNENFTSSSTNAFVFDELSTGINNDGDECKYLKGYDGTSYVKYPVSNEYTLPSSLSRGDILFVGRQGDEVCSVTSLVKTNSEPFYLSRYNSGSTASNASANMHAARLCFKGKMYGVNDGRDTIVVRATDEWDTYRAFSLAITNIVVYDSETDKLFLSSLAELPAASYDNPVEIGFVAQSSKVKTIVVYK